MNTLDSIITIATQAQASLSKITIQDIPTYALKNAVLDAELALIEIVDHAARQIAANEAVFMPLNKELPF